MRASVPAKGDAGLVVIACDKDRAVAEKLKARFGLAHLPELILSGALQQRVKLDEHLLE